MGLFGGLFEKKSCAICSKELGVFGKTKIADGSAYVCKDCSSKLSPHFHGYRAASVEDIQNQLAAREQNKAAVTAFNVTRTLGTNTKVYLDEDNGKVIITNSSPSNWANYNPDVLEYSQITGCECKVKESKTEIKRELPDGSEESYNPPRYDIDYDFIIQVHISHPYVSGMEFKVNQSRIDRMGSAEYRQAEQTAEAIKAALLGVREQQRAAAAPKQALTCPHCFATTMPDASGRCEFCGGSLAELL